MHVLSLIHILLGIPVIHISAAKNEGVDELVDHALHVAKYQERPGRMDFCSEDDLSLIHILQIEPSQTHFVRQLPRRGSFICADRKKPRSSPLGGAGIAQR